MTLASPAPPESLLERQLHAVTAILGDSSPGSQHPRDAIGNLEEFGVISRFEGLALFDGARKSNRGS